jgi:hypothetical protein
MTRHSKAALTGAASLNLVGFADLAAGTATTPPRGKRRHR